MKRIWVGFLVFSITFLVQAKASEQDERKIIGALKINGLETKDVTPKEVMELRFQFFDGETKKLLTKYKKAQMKTMHLVVIKSDLSRIAHIHPTLIGKTGTFSMIVNQVSNDPDNVDAKDAIAEPGKYFVYAEMFPDYGQLVPIPETIPFNLNALGEVKLKELKVDSPRADGKFIKYFKATKKEGRYGDPYRVTMWIERVPGVAGDLVKFKYRIHHWDTDKEAYLPVNDLQMWMMMSGHALIMSQDGESAEEKEFYHLHSMKSPLEDHLTFPHFDRKGMKGRVFRMWPQFKHKDVILTFPFTFKME